MKPAEVIKSFTERYPFVGPAFWIASVQYFIVQLIVAAAWPIRYSLRDHTLSDLGNTVCGLYNGRDVCSPHHLWMNISYVVLGTTMIFGAMLIYREFEQSKASMIGFIFMGLAGFGTLLVGLFPEDTINVLHSLGAFLPFIVGNIGMIILGLALDVPKWLKYYTVASGVVALSGALLFLSGVFFGLGSGGMERVAVYPQTVWLIVFGVYISSDHVKQQIQKHSAA